MVGNIAVGGGGHGGTRHLSLRQLGDDDVGVAGGALARLPQALGPPQSRPQPPDSTRGRRLEADRRLVSVLCSEEPTPPVLRPTHHLNGGLMVLRGGSVEGSKNGSEDPPTPCFQAYQPLQNHVLTLLFQAYTPFLNHLSTHPVFRPTHHSRTIFRPPLF